MLKVIIAAGIAATAPQSTASDEEGKSVRLLCEGRLTLFNEDKPEEKKIGPEAVSINYAERILKTPFAVLNITEVSDTEIKFSGPSQKLEIIGTVDRMSGTITIMWGTPEQWAEIKSGRPLAVDRTLVYDCKVAKPLF